MRIVQYKDGQYTDQYGYVHKCKYISASLEVERTDEFIAWEYYSEYLKDYVYITKDGRRFRYHTQTDYGPADMPFTELSVEERVVFYRYRKNVKSYWGICPLLEEKPSESTQLPQEAR